MSCSFLSKLNMSHMPLDLYAGLEKHLSMEIQNRLCSTHSEILKDLVDEALSLSSNEDDIEKNISALLNDQDFIIDLLRERGVL